MWLGIFKIQNQSQSGFFVHFRRSNVCINQLDVQETSCCLTQFHRVEGDIPWTLDCALDGISALDLWVLVIEVLHSSPKGDWAREDMSRKECENIRKDERNQHSSRRKNLVLEKIDYVPPNVNVSRHNAALYIF